MNKLNAKSPEINNDSQKNNVQSIGINAKSTKINGRSEKRIEPQRQIKHKKTMKATPNKQKSIRIDAKSKQQLRSMPNEQAKE